MSVFQWSQRVIACLFSLLTSANLLAAEPGEWQLAVLRDSNMTTLAKEAMITIIEHIDPSEEAKNLVAHFTNGKINPKLYVDKSFVETYGEKILEQMIQSKGCEYLPEFYSFRASANTRGCLLVIKLDYPHFMVRAFEAFEDPESGDVSLYAKRFYLKSDEAAEKVHQAHDDLGEALGVNHFMFSKGRLLLVTPLARKWVAKESAAAEANEKAPCLGHSCPCTMSAHLGGELGRRWLSRQSFGVGKIICPRESGVEEMYVKFVGRGIGFDSSVKVPAFTVKWTDVFNKLKIRHFLGEYILLDWNDIGTEVKNTKATRIQVSYSQDDLSGGSYGSLNFKMPLELLAVPSRAYPGYQSITLKKISKKKYDEHVLKVEEKNQSLRAGSE